MASFEKWPLGINPTMDRHAFEHGLRHWSCVSPNGNEWWVRCDGASFTPEFQRGDGYLADLRKFDEDHPCDKVLTVEYRARSLSAEMARVSLASPDGMPHTTVLKLDGVEALPWRKAVLTVEVGHHARLLVEYGILPKPINLAEAESSPNESTR